MGENRVELSVVIPIYNEAEVIPELARRLQKVLEAMGESFEVILVDDGSADVSYEMLEELHKRDGRWKVVKFSRNFGHQVAITAGLDAAEGEAIVVMDGDLQDPPEVIPKLVEKWKEGYDVVHAVREKRKGENWLRGAVIFVFYRLMNKLAGVDLPLDAGDFRLVSRRVVEVFKQFGERARYVRGLLTWVGLNQTSVYYVREGRAGGRSKYSVPRLIRLALDGITSFSNVPLRLASYVGFGISFLCLAYAAYVFAAKLIWGYAIPGYASLIVAILFLGGVQLIAVGILGEYIGRLYEESKRRPLYVIDRKLGIGTEGEKADRQ